MQSTRALCESTPKQMTALRKALKFILPVLWLLGCLISWAIDREPKHFEFDLDPEFEAWAVIEIHSDRGRLWMLADTGSNVSSMCDYSGPLLLTLPDKKSFVGLYVMNQGDVGNSFDTLQTMCKHRHLNGVLG